MRTIRRGGPFFCAIWRRLSVYAAALIARTGGTHVFVAEDRDAAAYLLNDF
ncbi:MAG: hypothetical protein ACLURY_02875 [Alistipes putredinis]